MNQDFQIEWDSQDGVWIARLIGRLDLSKAMNLEEMITARIEEKPAPLAIHLARMSYLPSAGVGALLNIHRFMVEHGQRVGLCDVPREVKRLLDIVEITALLPVYETQAEAVADLKS